LFTGLIERVGEVRSVTAESEDLRRISIYAPEIAHELRSGDSIAVSGVCLTAVDISGGVFSAQIMGETLRSSKLGALRAGDAVNLERSLPVGGRLDGHIVLGHVDKVGRVEKIEKTKRASKLWISVTTDISWGVAPKGSIALDGVSLTVIDSLESEFSVGLIPATHERTSIGLLAAGDPVNIEIDILARYVARFFGDTRALPPSDEKNAGGGSITFEKLAEYGWF
jgi:riboflavin synthase